MDLEFRATDGMRDKNVDVDNMQRVFKAMGMYEITQCVDRREKVGRLSPEYIEFSVWSDEVK